MKKAVFAVIFAMVFLMTGCSSSAASGTAPAQSEAVKPSETAAPPTTESSETTAAPAADAASEEQTSEAEQTEAPAAGSQKDTLVVYFSATGTTKGVAERIAKVTDADIYEIVPAEPYTDADLNYNDKNSRTTKEQNNKSIRPEIGSGTIDLSGYTTIYIGFPIWWGEEPRIMDTFVEQYDFTGKTLIPFCTSGGSGIGRSGPNMEALAGTGTWLAGARHSGSISEADLQSWIDGLK